MRTVKEVSRLSGVSVRTLHYYDEIGLLSPTKTTQAGYRLYDDAALSRLRQILFFRELDFPLKEIGEILSDPSFDETKALKNHRALLCLKQQRLERLIDLVDRILKGENIQDMKPFDQSEIQAAKEKYAAEAKERWGSTPAFAQSQKKAQGYTDAQWQSIQQEMDEIFSGFHRHMQQSPDAPEVQALVGRWQDHLSRYYYDCTPEILAGLGQMYTEDERFLQNIDSRYGAGTAAFLSAAIAAYVKQAQVL